MTSCLLLSVPVYADTGTSVKGLNYGIAGYDTGKNYTDSVKSEAANALATEINSVYMSVDSDRYKSLSNALSSYLKEFKEREGLNIMINTVFPIYKADYTSFIKSGKIELSNIPSPNNLETYSALLSHDDGSCAGSINLFYNPSTEKWTYGGYPGKESPERLSPTPEWTHDFRTFSVEIYKEIKQTKLDINKATARYIQFMDDATPGTRGTCYYFSDGVHEYVMPIGVQYSSSPFAASYTDRDTSIEYGLDSSGVIAFYELSNFHLLAVKDKAYLDSLPIEEGNPYIGGFTAVKASQESGKTNSGIWFIGGGLVIVAVLISVILTIRKKV